MIELIVAGGLLFIFLVFRSRFAEMGNRIARLFEKKRSRQLEIINAYRLDNGLAVLKEDAALHALAKRHSVCMAERGACGHRGEEERLDSVRKISGSRFAAENCFSYKRPFYGKRIDGRLPQTWLRAGQNRAHILNSNLKKIGVGVVSRKGQVYTTHLFSG